MVIVIEMRVIAILVKQASRRQPLAGPRNRSWSLRHIITTTEYASRRDMVVPTDTECPIRAKATYE